MNTILEQVQLYLTAAGKDEAEMSDEIVEEFGERCKDMLRKQFTPREEQPLFRLSAIGRPLCQQQFEKQGTEGSQEHYSLVMKFLLGNMVEAAAVAIMRGAGVNIQTLNGRVTAPIDGEDVPGEFDVEIDDEVWDIKSCSPWAFTKKFNADDGFQKMLDDDPFGYIPQGLLYGVGYGKRFGGWIAINKVTGAWAVLKTPANYSGVLATVVNKVTGNIKALKSDAPLERQFEPLEEVFNKKRTGNKVLGVTCSYCRFKDPCWGGVTHAPQPASKAENPKWHWYVGVPK